MDKEKFSVYLSDEDIEMLRSLLKARLGDYDELYKIFQYAKSVLVRS